jgi:ribulose 1,5-bisphosphate synthetase/thiazole synthase
MEAVVCSRFSCITEYGDVDRVVGAGCGVVLCSYHLAEACMKVCEFSFAVVVVNMGDFD